MPCATSRKPAPASSSPRIVAYVRVSSDMQVEDGHSLAMQEQVIRDYCDRHFGTGAYQITVERDEGKSGSWGWEPPSPGSKRYRPGLARVAAILEAGEAEYFVVYRSDRAFRNLLEQLKFRKRFLEDSPVTYISVTENLDLTNRTGVLANDVVALIAEYNRDALRDMVSDGNEKRRQDGYPTGHVGFGWRRTPKGEHGRPGVEPDPEQAPWVRQIYAWYLAGWGTPSIVRELERLGAPHAARCHLWRVRGVRALLQNPLHAGLIRDGETLRPGAHFEQRLVEVEEFDRVQREFARRHQEPGRPFNTGLCPLYRLARCGRCGSLLTAFDSDGVPNYRCRGTFQTGVQVLPAEELPADRRTVPRTALAAGSTALTESAAVVEHRDTDESGAVDTHTAEWCGGWSKSAPLIDHALIELLQGAVTVPEFQGLMEAEACRLLLEEGRDVLAGQRQDRIRALQKLRVQREKLLRAHLADRVSPEDYDRLYLELQGDLERTERELGELERRLADHQGEAALLSRIQEYLPRFALIWEALLPEERRQLLRDLTEYVVVQRVDGGRLALRVKVPFLPELQAEILHARSRAAGFAAGVAGLTQRELAALCLLGEGLSYPEVLERWNVKGGARTSLKRRILERLEVHTLEEAVALSAERVAQERGKLPLNVPAGTYNGSWRPTRAQRIPQVLERHLRGMSRSEIAAELGLALHSVRMAEYNARKKYGVATLPEALERFRAEQSPPDPEAALRETLAPKAPRRRRSQKAA